MDYFTHYPRTVSMEYGVSKAKLCDMDGINLGTSPNLMYVECTMITLNHTQVITQE